MPVVYLIDERFASSKALLGDVPPADLGFLIGPYLSVNDIVSMVHKELTPSAPTTLRRTFSRDAVETPMITALRIVAYGDGKELSLGRGIDARNAVELTPLAALFRGGASASCFLLGCEVSSGSQRERFLGGTATAHRLAAPSSICEVGDVNMRTGSGYPLLQNLARTLGVPVTASLDDPCSVRGFQFSGRTITMDPFGKTTFSGMDTPLGV
jgi:hypothetical protein